MSNIERELLVTLTDRLNALVAQAIDDVVGCDLGAQIVRAPREAVRAVRDADAAADFTCHACIAAFRRLRATSSLLSANLAFCDSEEDLARRVAERLSDARATGAAAGVIAAVVTRGGGLLLITSATHSDRQQARGRLACSICGRYFRGIKGLRAHQQIKHGEGYEEATSAAVAAEQQQLARLGAADDDAAIGADADGADMNAGDAGLCDLDGPTALRRLRAHWRAHARGERERQAALPHALALARDGDLEGLSAMRARELKEAGQRGGAATGSGIAATRDRHGSCAMLWACGGGHLHVCKWLVRECAMRPAASVQSDGRRPLHYAARNGRISVARWLVRDHAADANAASADGTVPLHWAVWRGELAMCKFLIHEAGANLSAVNKFGCNAIQWAAMTDGKELRVDEGQAAAGGGSGTGGAGLRPQQHMLPDAEGNTPTKAVKSTDNDFAKLIRAYCKANHDLLTQQQRISCNVVADTATNLKSAPRLGATCEDVAGDSRRNGNQGRYRKCHREGVKARRAERATRR
eukprot:g7886.t1